MNFTVQRFMFIIFFVLFGLLFLVSSYYYFTQKNKTATVILSALNSDISETGYILSKNIINEESLSAMRPYLDRVSANNDFALAIQIHNENRVLISTDPSYNDLMPTYTLYIEEKSAYENLTSLQTMEKGIRYYDNGSLKKLKLLFILDRDEINRYFDKNELNFILSFVLAPLLSILIFWMFIRWMITKPLEALRQFAYYQDKVPNIFRLKELEIIRYSMAQTFNRLENEKKELYSMARTDSLSGLANRNALNEHLERLILQCKRSGEEFAFLFLDLDHFKAINDSLGHNVGDELLRNVASMIDEVLRPKDFVARVGGDEFVVILQEYSSVMDLTNVMQRILDQLSRTWVIQTYPISITSSIGIAFYPKDGDDIVSLMKHSDIAMYEAKQKGRARYHFFTEELNQKVQNTISLNKEMVEALKNKEYELYYQPKVDVRTSKIIGAEALIRWISPSKGIISPDVFIPLAEENNFILLLGEWVVNEAIEQQSKFKKQNIDISVSINVSAKQILADGFTHTFVKTLERNNINPESIDIEITEYMFLEETVDSSKVLHELHKLGVTISLDDFGTGYSSLSYLKEFPIDHLKIDKSFIDDYATDQGTVFLETIVKMGQTLNMKVIAEGIEEKEQLEYLKSVGCNQYQGYYFSKPLPVKEFIELYSNS